VNKCEVEMEKTKYKEIEKEENILLFQAYSFNLQ
jgi:hypothetical protein